MVRESDFLTVGYVSAAHSLKGEIFIRLQAGHADWLGRWESLRLKKNDVVKSFAIISARPHKDGLIVKPEGVNDRNAAEDLIGYKLEIPAHLLTAEPGEQPFLYELLEFEVADRDQAIGRVMRFEFNGVQDLLVVEDSEGKEHLIPFVKDFVEEMDFSQKKMRMVLPPGLLEL